MELRNIITGTDFSEASLEAVRVAGRIADGSGASLTLAHVIARAPEVPAATPLAIAGSVDLVTLAAAQDRRLLEGAERHLAERRHTVLAGLPDVQTRMLFHSSVAAGLLDLSDAEDVDLLVVGSHGRTGLDRILLGSVAERVVRHASCPVLTVRGVVDQGAFPRRIVAATDFSSQSMTGVDLAAAWASEFDRPLSVVHVYDTTPLWPFTVPAEQASLDEVQAPLQRALEQLHQERLGGSVNVTMRLLASDSVAGGLCGHAEEDDVDLLVLSTLGSSGLKRLVLGTVAEKVVRHAPCCVLTVPVAE
jgi:nucleotide-binding universal stress UspA family protein